MSITNGDVLGALDRLREKLSKVTASTLEDPGEVARLTGELRATARWVELYVEDEERRFDGYIGEPGE